MQTVDIYNEICHLANKITSVAVDAIDGYATATQAKDAITSIMATITEYLNDIEGKI